MRYDKIYKKHKDPFGTKAAPIVREILKYKKSGSVIEFGAGTGRDSLFLAQQGFDVVATDISAEALKQIKDRAHEYDLGIEVHNLDVRGMILDKKYDILISIFLIHHLSKEEGERFLKTIQDHTAAGGLNAIAAFTKDGDFFQDNPETNHYYLDRGELKEKYSDWEILEFYEEKGRAFQKRPDGSPMFNVASFILAQKR